MTSTQPALVFDFGGVLFDWNPLYLYGKLFNGDRAAAQRFLDEIDFFGWNMQQDQGRSFAEAVAELSARFPHYAELICAYDERYEEALSGAIQPTVELLYMLERCGAELYGLTNWPAEKFRLVRGKYPFLGLFRDIVVSGEVRLAKPDPRIFHLLLERIGRPAGECIYIDDSAENVAVAHGLGFRALRFETTGQIAEALRQAGFRLETR